MTYTPYIYVGPRRAPGAGLGAAPSFMPADECRRRGGTVIGEGTRSERCVLEDDGAPPPSPAGAPYRPPVPLTARSSAPASKAAAVSRGLPLLHIPSAREALTPRRPPPPPLYKLFSAWTAAKPMWGGLSKPWYVRYKWPLLGGTAALLVGLVLLSRTRRRGSLA